MSYCFIKVNFRASEHTHMKKFHSSNTTQINLPVEGKPILNSYGSYLKKNKYIKKLSDTATASNATTIRTMGSSNLDRVDRAINQLLQWVWLKA